MFCGKGGRPRKNRPQKDFGTPELARHRAAGATEEMLDLCLARRLITPEMHWCGIHLRWLHTLRYGAPGVKALDTTHLGGMEIDADDPQWRALREEEYRIAISRLGYASARLLLGVVVYNERPEFLKPPPAQHVYRWAVRAGDEMLTFCQALETLDKLWSRMVPA